MDAENSLKSQLEDYIYNDIRLAEQSRRKSAKLSALRKRYNTLDKEYQDALRENHANANQLRHQKKRIDELEHTLTRTQSDIIRLQQNTDKSAEEMQRLRDQLAQKEEERATLTDHLGKVNAKVASLETQVGDAKQQLRLKDLEQKE